MNIIADQLQATITTNDLSDELEQLLIRSIKEILRLEKELAHKKGLIEQGNKYVDKLQGTIDQYEATTARLYEEIDRLDPVPPAA